MTDSFLLFGFPRRPSLDAEELKAAYFRLAAALHPDASQGDADQFANLQESLKVLGEPARRLRHLAELVFPGHASCPAAIGSGDLFLKVGGALQSAKAAVEKRDTAKSPLARAVLAGQVTAALKSVRDVIATVNGDETRLLESLAHLDARWPDVSPAELEELASALTYAARWRTQLSEWEFRLAQG